MLFADRMNRPLFHRLVALLCVLVTGFSGVARGYLVECRGPDGVRHLEWGGCSDDSAACCVSPCVAGQTDDAGSPGPAPCEDRPVNGEVGTATTRAVVAELALDMPLPGSGVLTILTDATPRHVLVARPVVRLAAPPPAMALIRTIVLLV